MTPPLLVIYYTYALPESDAVVPGFTYCDCLALLVVSIIELNFDAAIISLGGPILSTIEDY